MVTGQEVRRPGPGGGGDHMNGGGVQICSEAGRQDLGGGDPGEDSQQERVPELPGTPGVGVPVRAMGSTAWTVRCEDILAPLRQPCTPGRALCWRCGKQVETQRSQATCLESPA